MSQAPLEVWDVYDSHGRFQNRTVRRGEPLGEGEYHLVVQVWVRNSGGAYLTQRRAEHREILPGIRAPTAGLVLAGEISRDGARRELAEELGNNAGPVELRNLFQGMRENSVGTAWLLERDVSADEIVLQPSEVAETMWATPALIRRMVKRQTFYDYGLDYFDRLFGASI